MDMITDAAAAPALQAPHTLLDQMHRLMGTLVEVPAALLVLAEVVILLAGVVYRYLLHSPLVWSDELASILFLWLAMLGSVIAFQRGEHMRMTAVVGKLAPRARMFLDLLATAAAIAFLVFVIHPAIEFAQDEMFVTTPALELANAWRAAALPVGLGLMLLIGLIALCARIGLASKLKRVPEFTIQRAMLERQFQKAREQLERCRHPGRPHRAAPDCGGRHRCQHCPYRPLPRRQDRRAVQHRHLDNRC